MECKIPLLQSCCCVCTLQIGALILAWMYVICSIFWCGISVGVCFIEEIHTLHLVPLLVTSVILTIILTASSFLLLIGIYQERRMLVFLWMVVDTLISISVPITCFILGNIIYGIVSIVCSIINLYFVWVVYSYYQVMQNSRIPDDEMY